MKKNASGFSFAALLLAVSMANASEFDGWYIGVDAGSNKSTATALADKSSTYGGLVAGRNWDMGGYLLGANAFYDSHNSSYTKEDAGLDLKLGLPMGQWLPYLKAGLAATTPGTRVHAGLGVEYKFADSWSVNGEWMTDKKADSGVDYKNNNFVVGLNYYFEGGRKAAGAAAADEAARQAAARDAAAREAAARDAADRAAKEAAAKQTAEAAEAKEAAAKEASREAWKASIIEKPVRLEGANFASGSSKLLPGADAKLDEVVNAATQFPDVQLDVSGHTDNVGNAAKNVKLSQERADAVKAYLVKKGVAAERIHTKGYGADNPIAGNDTAEGRAKNRRVEVKYSIKEEKKERVQ